MQRFPERRKDIWIQGSSDDGVGHTLYEDTENMPYGIADCTRRDHACNNIAKALCVLSNINIFRVPRERVIIQGAWVVLVVYSNSSCPSSTRGDMFWIAEETPERNLFVTITVLPAWSLLSAPTEP